MGKFVVRLRPALRVALVAGAAVALIVGSRSNAADHGDAPYSEPNQLVSSELRPLAGQQASGIVHLGHKREGQDSVAATFVNLVPGDSYTLGLTRRACRGLPEVSQFFDIPGVIVADSNGTASVRRSGLDLTRQNLPPAKSAVLRTTADDDPVSCGRLWVWTMGS